MTSAGAIREPRGAHAVPRSVTIAGGQALVFSVGGQRFALALDHVQEIQHIVEFASASAEDGPLVGVVNLRGEIVPVVDVRKAFGMPDASYTLETPMVICAGDGELAALIVDCVHEVAAVPSEGVQDPPLLRSLESRLAGAFASDDGLVYLIDPVALLGELATGGAAR